ncbi:MAG: hypothetical protein NZ524_00075 [Thiobacillaceae bacterium]|nr:hypothetical protein [Thiobacillaceae bacterium]
MHRLLGVRRAYVQERLRHEQAVPALKPGGGRVRMDLSHILLWAMLHLFNKTNLPMTVVVLLILWAWISLISVILSRLF